MIARPPKKRFLFVDDHTRIALWLRWQSLRRNRKYKNAVQTCLQDIRKHLVMLQAILAYYIPSDADARPYIGTEHATIRHFVHMQSFLNNMDRLSHGLRSHPVLTTYEPGDVEAMAHAYLQAAPYPLEKRAATALHSLCRPEHRDAFDAILCHDLPGLRLQRGTAPRPVGPDRTVAERLHDLLEAGQGIVFLHHALAGWPGWPAWAEVLGCAHGVRARGRAHRPYRSAPLGLCWDIRSGSGTMARLPRDAWGRPPAPAPGPHWRPPVVQPLLCRGR